MAAPAALDNGLVVEVELAWASAVPE